MQSPQNRSYEVNAAEITRLRESKGLTIERLAAKADLHVRTLKNILKGGKCLLRTLIRLAAALGVDPSSLRLDLSEQSEVRRSNYTITLKLSGWLDLSAPVRGILPLSPTMMAEIEKCGMHVRTYQAKTSFTETVGADPFRIIYQFGAVAKDGGDLHIYISVPPEKQPPLYQAFLSRRLDQCNLEEYGTIITARYTGIDKRPLSGQELQCIFNDLYNEGAEIFMHRVKYDSEDNPDRPYPLTPWPPTST